MYIAEKDQQPGQKYRIEVWYNFKTTDGDHPHKDYTVKVYSKHDLEILDADQKTNQLHTDGSEPSEFKVSL